MRTTLSWGDVPDELVGWLPFALMRSFRLLRTRELSVIYASGPPFTVVLAGALLSRASGVPLVADFRDTWMLDASDPFGTIGGVYRSRPSAAKRKLLERMEAWCLDRSAAVLFTSEATKARYEHAHPSLVSRSRLIFNGADPMDFQDPVEPFERPTLSHVGTIHEYQAAQVLLLLEGWATLARRNQLSSSCLTFVGSIVPAVRSRIDAALARLELSGKVQFIGPVPHRQAVAWLRRSTALVLFAGENQYIRLSKISEYAAAARPLLAFAAPGSETARDVAHHGALLPAGDGPAPVAEAIRIVLREGLARRPGTVPFPFLHPHPLNRRSEAAELAALLDRLSGPRA